MKKKVIELPKGYLSYSQYSLWNQSPERYAALYFDKREEMRFDNDGMRYGKEVANALEKGVETGDLRTDAAMLLLPKYDVADEEITAEFKTDYGWLKLLGRPDSFDSKTLSFYEYKTGISPWTQNKASKHFQMQFYAMMIYIIHKRVPPHSELIWIETEKDMNGATRPTGVIKRFPVEISLSSVMDTMAKVTKTAHEIEIAWACHTPYITTF